MHALWTLLRAQEIQTGEQKSNTAFLTGEIDESRFLLSGSGPEARQQEAFKARPPAGPVPIARKRDGARGVACRSA